MTYKLHNDIRTGELSSIIKTSEDGTTRCFLADPANTDYQAYLKWLEEGNQPLPAEEQ